MQQTQANTYFDLHVEGEGFLSRVRHVSVRKGKPFLAVSIGAFHGQPGEYTFVNLDCKVVGNSAISLIKDKLMEAANDKNKKVIYIHNPSGYYDKSQINHEIPQSDFKRFFSGKGIIIMSKDNNQ